MRYMFFILCLSALVCTYSCEIVETDKIGIEVSILPPSGRGMEMLGLSLKINNMDSRPIRIRQIELWLLNAEGQLWPSGERGIKILEVNRDFAPGEEQELFFILNDPASGSPEGLKVRIIRVNNFPYHSRSPESGFKPRGY